MREGTTMKRRLLIRGALAAPLLVAMPGARSARLEPMPKEPSGAQPPKARRQNRFPNMRLTSHEGKTVRFYDDLVRDKTVVIHFMYTNCTDSCPLTTANLAKVQTALRSRVGRDLFLYSITVDPEHDTPRMLREYAERFDVRPGWLFLTGTTQDIRTLRRTFGDEPTGRFEQSDHLRLLAYGVEPLERWAKCSAMLNPKWIARYVAWLDPKGERPTGWWPPGRGI
jgi:protein SCO1